MAKKNMQDHWQNDLFELIDTSNWRNDVGDRRHVAKVLIWNRSIKGLEMIIASGWDVNDLATRWTLLQRAVTNLWKEGVMRLIKAGADVNLSEQYYKDPPLLEAIKANFQHVQTPENAEKREVQVDIIKLLLEYGADPNTVGVFGEIPLTCAIQQSARFDFDTRIIDLLLENGADACQHHLSISPLSCTFNLLKDFLKQSRDPSAEGEDNVIISGNAAIFKSLVKFGAELDMQMPNPMPMLHEMVGPKINRFLPNHLDVCFQSGGDVDVALIYCIEEDGLTNNVRWLMRHGADTTRMKLWYFMKHLIPYYNTSHVKRQMTPFVLLKAGFRVSNSMVEALTDIKQYLLMCVEQREHDEVCTPCEIRRKCSYLIRHADSSQTSNENGEKKCISIHVRLKQMADLQEFSDESLNVYQEDEEIGVPEKLQNYSSRRITELQFSLLMFTNLLDYLAQPHTLQWWCRCCIRESLVSLHPSAVKTLSSPSSLKRYILCHDL